MGKAVQYLEGVVGGSTVQDDVLHAWPLLANHAQERIFEELSTVERGGDDGESWNVHCALRYEQPACRRLKRLLKNPKSRSLAD
jgi:hypothetical protein